MKVLKSVLFLLLLQISSQAQKKWTLKECIDYALKNNISIQQAAVSAQIAEAAFNQSLGSFFPSINGSAGLNYNFGRSLDPTSYQYINKTFQSGTLSLSSSIPLFQGFELQHNLKKANLDLQAGITDIKKTQNDIALAVASAYLQVLYASEQLNAANIRIEAVTKEKNRTKLLVDNELLAEGSLLDAEALLATEEYNKISIENLLVSSKINLVQLMQLDSVSDIQIETPELEIPSQESLSLTAQSIYNEALKILPEIKSSELKLLSAKQSLSIARSSRYPKLSAFGSLSSNFSNQAQNVTGKDLIGYAPTGALTSSGEQVLQPIFNYHYQDISIRDQVDQNFGKAVGFSLSIPIFNGWAVNSNIKRAKLNVENSQLIHKQTKNNVYKNVLQAHTDAVAALNKYIASEKSVNAQNKAFLYTEKKFNAGLLNSIDYVNARNNLTRSQTDFIQAKFDLILKIKVLDYYLGKPLAF
jgi:outer membrane protein